MPTQDNNLEIELQTYKDHLSEWADHAGEFVLIGGTSVEGFYDHYEEALREGYTRFGVVAFLVKKVTDPPQAQFVSRMFSPTAVR